jgi:prefoldin subunit 5
MSGHSLVEISNVTARCVGSCCRQAGLCYRKTSTCYRRLAQFLMRLCFLYCQFPAPVFDNLRLGHHSQSDPNMASTTEAPATNPRGIPVFPFMSNVSDYVKSIEDVESTLQRFQEMTSKYTFMQQNVDRRAAGLKEKLPEMKNTYDTVKFLEMKRKLALEKSEAEQGDDLHDDLEEPKHNSQELETTFSLQDTLYAKALIKPAEVEEVYLWLGANVMVAYPLTEAEELLRSKLEKAKESLKAAEEDLEFLRVQITTLEVAIARVHNWDVGEKRRLKLEGKLKEDDKEKE